LNLQHASVVVNMDLPWNPAVLEQRIGRVHRLGQHRPVRVVNFVAQDSIEEGMLPVLQFKKALFAGVLDDGAREVFLGGSRLTRFMETVEKTTGAIGRTVFEESEPRAGGVERDGAREARNGRNPRGRREGREERPEGATPLPAGAPASDPWQALLQAGLTVLEQMARASGAAAGFTGGTLPDPSHDRRDGRGRDGRARRERRQEGGGGHGRGGRDAGGRPDGLRARDSGDVRDGLRVVERDPRTGQGYLKVPLPSPEVLDRALHAIGSMLQQFKR